MLDLVPSFDVSAVWIGQDWTKESSGAMTALMAIRRGAVERSVIRNEVVE